MVHGDVHDPAAAGREHARHHLTGDQEIAGQVGRDHVAEPGRRHCPELPRLRHEARVHRAHADARVVHQHVDAAQARPRELHAAGNRFLVADVEFDAERAGKAVSGRVGPLP